MDRVTNISWRTSGGASLGGFAYEYDAVGRIVSRSHALGTNAFNRAYTYDDLDRLASDGGVSYTYDAAGNRTTKTENGETITYSLGAGDRLASWTGGAYSYDVAGCVTRIERDGKPTLDLTWNGLYQLVSVSTNGVFAEGYAYDALGRRVSTTSAEGTTRHVYDDNWQVIADIDEQGNAIVSYTWGDGIDNLLAVKSGGLSLYSFCGENPLTFIDPLGRSFWPEAIDRWGRFNRCANPGLIGSWIWHHYVREYLNAPLPETPPSVEGTGWRKLSRKESVFHDNGDEYEECKYVHKDGREVVYDGAVCYNGACKFTNNCFFVMVDCEMCDNLLFP